MSTNTDTLDIINNASAASGRETLVNADGDCMLDCFLNLGEIMLRAGAEVNRVEDTIRRIGHAYDCKRVEIFTINNMISLTVITHDDKVFTQTRRVSVAAVDLEKVARANELSRQICKTPVSLGELRARITDIAENTRHYGKRMRYIASVVSATAFTVFFGGNWIEALISGAVSVILVTCMLFSDRLKIRPIIAILVSAFVMTVCVQGVTYFIDAAAMDSIIMGNIMLLIPGLALTTSIRDVITGDTVAGLMGICDALLKAFAIAVGCVSAMLIFK